MSDFSKPMEVDTTTAAFPAKVVGVFMPDYAEIPREFKGGTKWNDLVGDWFFSGLESFDSEPKEGIDKKKALRHVGTILGSFEPKHEHKEAAAAYLLSLWFKEPKWTAAKRKVGR